MTRINVIAISELEPKILSGEFHEITRAFTHVRKAVEKGKAVSDYKIPPAYKLGNGHVTFFYNKLEYISNRYISLALELRYRAVKLNKDSSCDLKQVLKIIDDARSDIPQDWWNDYTPTSEAININQQRLQGNL